MKFLPTRWPGLSRPSHVAKRGEQSTMVRSLKDSTRKPMLLAERRVLKGGARREGGRETAKGHREQDMVFNGDPLPLLPICKWPPRVRRPRWMGAREGQAAGKEGRDRQDGVPALT